MANKTDETKHFLVELDSLLDTRLGTLEKFSPPTALRVYKNPDYYSRDWDNWEGLSGGGITNDQFQTLYAERNVEVLEKSRPTQLLGMLGKITKELDMSRITAPDVEEIKVSINTYPYTLTIDEKRMLETLVFHYCALGTDVDTVEFKPEDLSPSFIKDRYDGVIMYEFDKWFTHHVTELNSVLIPRNVVFAPALYIKNPDALVEETPEEFLNVSPFSQFEMALVERLGLELLNAKEFSVVPFEGQRA